MIEDAPSTLQEVASGDNSPYYLDPHGSNCEWKIKSKDAQARIRNAACIVTRLPHITEIRAGLSLAEWAINISLLAFLIGVAEHV